MTARSGRNIVQFERVAVVLSGGGALGSYQAGALARMEEAVQQPNWLAGIGTGAFNAAIVAGNPPGRRGVKLLSFWRRLGEVARRSGPGFWGRAWYRIAERRRIDLRGGVLGEPLMPRAPAVDSAQLRALLAESIDFARINAGLTRLTLGTTHLPTGADIAFDNDRHKIGLDHVMASAALPGGLPPVMIEGEPYGNCAVLSINALSALLDGAPPADTLCFIIDGFDPAPPEQPGASRAGQQIAEFRRRHDLRRIIGLLGEKLPAALRRDPELRRCLAQGSTATVNLVHIVHESGGGTLADHLGDFSGAGLARRWRAGELDMAASLARSGWLAPSAQRVGVVVHEMRGNGVRSRIR
ncbi:MAG: DUF3734 domain-containing protein [Alphaproteobacteria bacterium]|nr:DUF3734 domain-containing protein [Alphaproteobacteria bacterium]